MRITHHQQSKGGHSSSTQQVPSLLKMPPSPWPPLCIPLSLHQPPTFALLKTTAMSYISNGLFPFHSLGPPPPVQSPGHQG